MGSWYWLFVAPWIVFGLWWAVRSLGTARTAERESLTSRLSHAIFLGSGALLLALPPAGLLGRRLWPGSLPLGCVGLAIDVAGVGFAIWAREHLGRLWSGTITLKEGHRVVQTGPYRWARHPIYTGILTGVAGVVLARGDVATVLALALFSFGVARKIAIEERLLVGHFGAEYESYRQKVKAIIPFVW